MVFVHQSVDFIYHWFSATFVTDWSSSLIELHQLVAFVTLQPSPVNSLLVGDLHQKLTFDIQPTFEPTNTNMFSSFFLQAILTKFFEDLHNIYINQIFELTFTGN